MEATMRVFFNVVKATVVLAAIFVLATILTMVIGAIEPAFLAWSNDVGIHTTTCLLLATVLIFLFTFAVKLSQQEPLEGSEMVAVSLLAIIIPLVIYGIDKGINTLLDNISDEYIQRLLFSGGLVCLLVVAIGILMCTHQEIERILFWTPKPPQQPNNKK